MISPPVGLNVFVLRTVLPEVATSDVFRGVTPFIVAELLEDIGQLDDLVELGGQSGAQRQRHGTRRQHAQPARVFPSGHGLAGRGQIGHVGMAHQRGLGDGAQLARIDKRLQRTARADVHLRPPGEHIQDAGVGALVMH